MKKYVVVPLVMVMFALQGCMGAMALGYIGVAGGARHYVANRKADKCTEAQFGSGTAEEKYHEKQRLGCK